MVINLLHGLKQPPLLLVQFMHFLSFSLKQQLIISQGKKFQLLLFGLHKFLVRASLGAV